MTSSDTGYGFEATPVNPVDKPIPVGGVPIENQEPDALLDNPSLRESLWASPARVWFRSTKWGSKLSNTTDNLIDVGGTLGSEIVEKGAVVGPLGAAAASTAVGITQYYDRTRVFLRNAPPRAIDAMVDMDFSRTSSLVAAGIVAGSFAVWNFFAGEVLNRTIELFPKTKDKIVENFPRMSRAAELAIPSEIKKYNQSLIPSANEDGNGGSEEVAINKGLAARVKRGAKRGWNGIGFGSTIYMGVSSINDVPVNQRSRINAEVSRDTSLFAIFPISLITAELVRQAATGGNAELAATVLSWVEDGQNWQKFGYGVMAGTVILNYLARKNVDLNEEAKAS